MLVLFKTICEYLNVVIVLSTAGTILIKPIRKFVIKKIKEVSDTEQRNKVDEDILQMLKDQQEVLQAMRDDIDKLKENDGKRDTTDVCILRNMITNIYYTHLATKRLPIYTRENLVYLFEEYDKKHGNSYVRHLYAEMMEWDIEDSNS